MNRTKIVNKDQGIFLSIWVDWIFITVLYFLAMGFIVISNDGTASVYIFSFISWFVPLDIWKFVDLFQGFQWLLLLPLLVSALFFGEFIGKKRIPNPYWRMLFNLAVLLCLTMIFDLIVLHQLSPMPNLSVGPIITL
jgi:hypothetical protein